MGNTTSVITDTAYSWLYPSGEGYEEVSLKPTDPQEFVLCRSIKFAYRKELKHYFLSPNEHWTTDKIIPEESYLRIQKIIRFNTGRVQVFARFGNEEGLFDVSEFFSAITPVIINRQYIKEYCHRVDIKSDIHKSSPIEYNGPVNEYSISDLGPSRLPPMDFFSKSC